MNVTDSEHGNIGDTEKGSKKGDNESLEQLQEFESDGYNMDYNDMDTGWAWIVLLSSFGTFCFLGSALYAVGIIHSTLLDRYQESLSLTSWAGALHTALISLAGPLSSAISDRYSCRVAIVTAGVLYVFGYLGTAVAPNIEVAILTCGVISGIAGGIAFTANMVIIGFYFKKRRNLAIGIAISGNGAGLFIFAPLQQFLRVHYGPVGFFIMLAGMFANMITLGMLCFPSKLEKHIMRQRARTLERHGEQPRKPRFNCDLLKRYWGVFTTKPIFFLSMSSLNYCLAAYLLFIYFPDFIVYRGFLPAQAAFFVSIAGIFNIVGRVGFGFIANNPSTNVLLIYTSSMVIVAVISCIYPFVAHHYYGHVTYFVLLGLFMGPPFSLLTSVILHFVGIETMAISIGIVFGCGGIGAIVGPVSAGVLIDSGGTYEQSIILAGSCSMVAALFGGATMCMKQRQETQLTISITENDTEQKKEMLSNV